MKALHLLEVQKRSIKNEELERSLEAILVFLLDGWLHHGRTVLACGTEYGTGTSGLIVSCEILVADKSMHGIGTLVKVRGLVDLIVILGVSVLGQSNS